MPWSQRLPLVRDKLVVWKNGPDGLQAIDLGGFQSRHEAVLGLLEQADREHCVPEFGPLLVHTLDRPVSTPEQPWRSYAFCTTDGFLDVPVPDFVFGGWPEVGIDDFDETCRRVQTAGYEPARLSVVGWIGNARTHPVRSALLRLGQQHPDLLDVQQVDWVPDPTQRRLQSSGGNPCPSVSRQLAGPHCWTWRARVTAGGSSCFCTAVDQCSFRSGRGGSGSGTAWCR